MLSIDRISRLLAAPEPGEGTPPPEGGTRDGYVKALLYLARHHGRPVTREALLAGLPLDTGEDLTAALVERAAVNAGLEAMAVERPLDAIPALVLPAIIIADSRVQILLRKDDELQAALVCDPERDETARAIPLPALTQIYSGYGFFVRPLMAESQPRQEAEHRPLLKMDWFWSVVGQFRGHYAHIALAALLINILALVFPLFTMVLYDRIIPNGAISSLVALSIGVALSFLFDAVLRLARSKVIDQAGKQADLTLVGRIFDHVMGLPLRSKPPNIGVVAHQIRDFDGVREFLTSSTLVAASDLVFALLFLVVIIVIGGHLAWVLVVLVPVMLAIGYAMQKPLEEASRYLQQEAAARHGILIESLAGFETLKTLGAEGRRQKIFERAVAASTKSGEAVHHWSTLAMVLTNTVQQFAQLALYIVGVFLVLNNQISVGALVASGMLMMRVVTPITNMASMLTRSAQTLVALRGIDRIMQMPVERPKGRVFTARRVKEGSVSFEGVTFAYPGAAGPALQDLSLTIRAGERVGIIGRIGSGKTTFGRLLTAMHWPDEGRILVDGADIRQYDPADLRAGIGLVQQDVDLFQGSLRENLVLGRPQASDEDVLRAARLGGVESFAALHPLGYDMPISEGGRSLSGGQRQSIALARVLIRDPKIFFMDEPTSALDMRSETEFCERLNHIMTPGSTLIIATHRLSLLRYVERIVVIENGKLVMDGPRDAVLRSLQGTGG